MLECRCGSTNILIIRTAADYAICVCRSCDHWWHQKGF